MTRLQRASRVVEEKLRKKLAQSVKDASSVSLTDGPVRSVRPVKRNGTQSQSILSELISSYVKTTEVKVVSNRGGGDRFSVHYPEQQPLELDFSPFYQLISGYRAHVALIHWQAFPKGMRRWGMYLTHVPTAVTKYLVADNVYIDAPSRTLQLDESVVKTLPTAVILVPDCVALFEGDGVRVNYRIQRRTT